MENRGNKTVADICRIVGITPVTLYKWKEKYGTSSEVSSNITTNSSLDDAERAELQKLRKENEELRMEREILKKAATFFAKESQ